MARRDMDPVTNDAKEAWAPPTIEEIDYGQTEANPYFGGADNGFYTS